MKYIYVIAPNRDGPSKIGIATNLRKRLEALQIGYWDELHLCWFGAYYLPDQRGAAYGIGQIFVTAEMTAKRLEWAAHKKLKKIGYHIRGEWFDLCPEDAAKVVEKIAKKSQVKPIEPEDLRQYMDLYGPQSDGNRTNMRELRSFSDSMEFGRSAVNRFCAEFPKVKVAC